ncbi:Glucose-1-phosphate adenylyltransferase large subunit 1 [Arachis hypogaea]|uniref:glucose-1-phosphate adenylyltransferase n=1 Tax=Arachis hypogaea TaxID=3818 RepID=A0A6B9V918_ARAHY|nr:Glucose-1-phosphate adenylyltransferase large subunit 1 [Arachis hypogaea]
MDDSLPPPFISLPSSSPPSSVAGGVMNGDCGVSEFSLTSQSDNLIQIVEVKALGQGRGFDIDLVNKVYILTQFNLASINRHIARAYNSGTGVTFGDGYVEVLVATQTPGEAGKRWFQGTADVDPRSKDIEDVLILSEDHLYRMDYMDFVQNHCESGVDITLFCLPMDDSRASDFGLMKIDDKGRILSFSEKSKGEDLKAMVITHVCAAFYILGVSRIRFTANTAS